MSHLSDKEFEAQMDVDTLKRAKEIEGDPKRAEAARTALDKELKILNALKGSTLLTKEGGTLITK